MSIFSPKLDATPAEMAYRLSDLLSTLSRGFDQAVVETVNRGNTVGESIYQAMKDKTGGLVAFSMEFAIQNTLRPEESEAILKEMYMLHAYDKKYYIQRFQGIPAARNRWAQAGREYLIAGMAFQECCGTTGNPDADSLIKQFGANTFSNVFALTKDELKKVRLRL